MKKLFSVLMCILLFAPALKAKDIELSMHNTMVFNAPVSGENVNLAMSVLDSLVAERGEADYPIYLVLDCPGGEIYSGEAFIQYLKKIPKLETVTLFAASMCSSIAEAVPGTRHVVENGIFMFHRAQGNFEGYFESGEVESRLALWKSVVKHIELRNSKRINMSLADYKAKVVTEWWTYGEESVDAHVADDVVDINCTKELKDAGACPLYRSYKY